MKKKILALTLALLLSATGLLIPAVQGNAASDLTRFSPSFEGLSTAEELANTSVNDIKVATMKIKSPLALVNGKSRNIDTANSKVTPIISNGRTMIPLRFCGDVLGAKTKYISNKDFITVTLGEQQAKFKLGSKTMQIVNAKSGKVLKTVTLDVAPLIYNTRTMVPVRAITEGLGSTVKYQKIGLLEEFVVVSSASLSSQQRTETIYRLQRLKAWIYKNQAAAYQITYPKGWGVVPKTKDGKVVDIAINEKYLDATIEAQDVPAADAKDHVNASKSEEEGLYGPITGFAKITIGGKKAVRFTCKQKGYDVTMCIISSAKSGMVIMLVSIPGTTPPTDEFKTIYTSIKMLK